MSLFLDKEIVANSNQANAQHVEVVNRREVFARRENVFGQDYGMEYNAAARIPQDAFRDFDRTVKRVMTGDEGQNIITMLPSTSISIGKIVSEYGIVSDSGQGSSTIAGRNATKMDRSVMDYDGTLILMHDDGFGRQWREVEAMRTEDFDELQEDQANSVRTVRRLVANHVMLGVDNITYKGRQAYGMKNSPNVQSLDLDGTGGIGVDLTSPSATYEDFETAIVAALTLLQGSANNVEMDISFAVSNEIWFNTLRRESANFAAGTIMERLRRIPGVATIVRTAGSQLTGNEFFAWANSEEYIQIKSGMAVNTVPVPRNMFNDDFNFITWAAAGLQIRKDAAGRSGVAYAREIA